jgi:PAS domain S-box-containing protein
VKSSNQTFLNLPENASQSDLLKHLESALTSAGFAAWSMDVKTMEVWRSQNHDQIFGYESNIPNWSHEVFMKHVHPEDRVALDNSFKESLSKERFSIRFRIKPAYIETDRWLEVSGGAVKDSQEQTICVLGVVRDITDLVINEFKILDNVKMRSLGEMAGGLAHEVNNPITIIKLRAEVILSKARAGKLDPQSVIAGLEGIVSSADRVASIIRGLQMFSKEPDKDPLVSINLKTLACDTIELVRTKFKNENIDILIEIPPEIYIECHPSQIAQVLMNCVVNSRNILVTKLQEGRWIKITAVKESESVELHIIDSGDGIPEEIAKNIFEPFFTTQRSEKRPGLGLSISRGIVESHSGVLFYDPNAKNTTFTLVLPLKQTS